MMIVLIIKVLWLNLHDLEKLTNRLKCYNQVSCKIHRNGELIKPVAIGAIGYIDEEISSCAKNYGLPIVLCYPELIAINYHGDILTDRD